MSFHFPLLGLWDIRIQSWFCDEVMVPTLKLIIILQILDLFDYTFYMHGIIFLKINHLTQISQILEEFHILSVFF